MAIIAGAMGFLVCAAGLTFYALGQKSSYFYMPGDLDGRPVAAGARIRLGGLVDVGSLARGPGAEVRFAVTDTEHRVNVVHTGLLPDLFREGQGVVAEGHFNDEGVFVADTVLAKHDETYMPREVAESLKEKGLWQDPDDVPDAR